MIAKDNGDGVVFMANLFKFVQYLTNVVVCVRDGRLALQRHHHGERNQRVFPLLYGRVRQDQT